MMKVTFTEKDFSELRKFQNAFNKKLGETAYVGTDYATLVVEYSSELKAMLRPFPSSQHFEFEVRCLTCVDCKNNQPFLCAVEETTYLCSDCVGKRQKKGK